MKVTYIDHKLNRKLEFWDPNKGLNFTSTCPVPLWSIFCTFPPAFLPVSLHKEKTESLGRTEVNSLLHAANKQSKCNFLKCWNREATNNKHQQQRSANICSALLSTQVRGASVPSEASERHGHAPHCLQSNVHSLFIYNLTTLFQ